jgi:hypothetical protein
MPARCAIRRASTLVAALLLFALAACSVVGRPDYDDTYRQGGKHPGRLRENT